MNNNKATRSLKSQEERTKRHRLVLFLCYKMLVSKIVEGMNGKLEIESEVGKGTNVKIIFTGNDSVYGLDSIINP